MTESLFDQIGIKVNYAAPLCKTGGEQGNITRAITSYQQETLALGGYWTADIGFVASRKKAESWYAFGLGRQIKTYTKSGKVWEGFVNQVQVNAGAVTETRGPLLDIGNRVAAIYTPKDFSVYPPVTGTETTTILVEDESSQNEFGIVEKLLSAGQCTDDTAEQLRDIFLQDNSWPKNTGPVSIQPGSSQNPSVTLNCLGNVHWLAAFVYEDTTAGYSYISDKLIAIRNAEPNGYFPVDNTHIIDNLFLVATADSGRYGLDIITELLNLGNDTDDNRRNFGVYDDLVMYYDTIPTQYEYKHRLSDPAQRVLNRGDKIVYPWAVRPGKWIFVPDFVPGFIAPNSNLRSDPRWKFLESVRYTAPYSLDLSGNQTDRLSQALAKVNMNGGFL